MAPSRRLNDRECREGNRPACARPDPPPVTLKLGRLDGLYRNAKTASSNCTRHTLREPVRVGPSGVQRMCSTAQIDHRDHSSMSAIFHPLLALIASVSDRQLARYVEFLKAENKILRTRIKGQVHTRPDERRRLLQLGKALGQGIEEIITLVTPATFYRWMRDENEPEVKRPKGGSRKPREIRELVIEIAKTTGFGYTRILGELRKLGIRKISRQTVRNILKEEGIVPGPNRTSDSWDSFLKRHAEKLWAVDFFSVRTLTTRGLRTTYLMAFLCRETCRRWAPFRMRS